MGSRIGEVGQEERGKPKSRGRPGRVIGPSSRKSEMALEGPPLSVSAVPLPCNLAVHMHCFCRTVAACRHNTAGYWTIYSCNAAGGSLCEAITYSKLLKSSRRAVKGR